MIILDTNVVSEPLRPQPDAAVVSWLDRQSDQTLFITSVTRAEGLLGVAVLPGGRRRDELAAALDEVLGAFVGRTLPFDTAAADAYALIAATARAAGLALSVPDGYIAAIAAARGYAVATRDTAPFMAAGVKTINPWLDEREPRRSCPT